MNKHFTFDYVGMDDLSILLKTGIIGYATEARVGGRLERLWLFLQNEVVEVSSEVNAIDDWDEVGTLKFKRVSEADSIPNRSLIESTWLNVNSVYKLQIDGESFKAESGILLKNIAGNCIYIVAGALPLTVELKADFYVNDFQPEYDLKEYSQRHL